MSLKIKNEEQLEKDINPCIKVYGFGAKVELMPFVGECAKGHKEALVHIVLTETGLDLGEEPDIMSVTLSQFQVQRLVDALVWSLNQAKMKANQRTKRKYTRKAKAKKAEKKA